MLSGDLFSYQAAISSGVGGTPSKPISDAVARRPVVHLVGQSGRAVKYPEHAGWKEPTTSKDAAEKIEATGRAELLRQRVLFALRKPQTAKQVAASLGEEITSIRPRITELKQRLLVEETGERSEGQHIYAAV